MKQAATIVDRAAAAPAIGLHEDIISLAEAAKLLPRRRAGKKTSVATIYRWTKDGMRGVHLEFIQVGGTRCTSQEALQRFFDRLSENAVSPGTRSGWKRRQDTEEAARELERLGV